jgi:hypothetical protein
MQECQIAFTNAYGLDTEENPLQDEANQAKEEVDGIYEELGL